MAKHANLPTEHFSDLVGGQVISNPIFLKGPDHDRVSWVGHRTGLPTRTSFGQLPKFRRCHSDEVRKDCSNLIEYTNRWWAYEYTFGIHNLNTKIMQHIARTSGVANLFVQIVPAFFKMGLFFIYFGPSEANKTIFKTK